MKMNKYTVALAALGLVSLAGVAQAQTTVYLTGSTACRALVYQAFTAGDVFTGGAAGCTVIDPQNKKGSAQFIVYQGNITGVGTVNVSCDWSGSEAGIAAVAGNNTAVVQQLTIPAPNGNGTLTTYNLPNVPAAFLQPGNGFALPATQLPGGTLPDIAMADTTQAVSLTPPSVKALTHVGTVGYVTFSVMKGANSKPDTSWNDLVNVTDSAMNSIFSLPTPAWFFTGNGPSTDTDTVYLDGRNKGSGTRANAELSFGVALSSVVDQYAWTTDGNLSDLYPDSPQDGILTFQTIPSGTTPVITETLNDGFDSGGSVAKTLAVDSFGSSSLMIGYIGLADAQSAGNAVHLSWNGVYEGDQSVINGSWIYWGIESMYGNPTTITSINGTSAQAKTSKALFNGIQTALGQANGSVTSANAAGACSGNVHTTPAQSVLIPVSLMNVTRSADGGYPSPK